MEELKQLPLDSSLQANIDAREYAARVAAIRSRLENANPGPWKTVSQSEFGADWTIAFSIGYHEETGDSILVVTDGVHASRLVSDAQDDAEFIAHARSDVPWLLEQLEALHREEPPSDRYDEVVSDLIDTVQAVEAERDALRAELARVKDELEIAQMLTRSAHETAAAAWGGEIPSPLPGHKSMTEEETLALFDHLNCPLCGGSGHIDDTDPDIRTGLSRNAELIKRLDALVEAYNEWDACIFKSITARKPVYEKLEAARAAVAEMREGEKA